MGTRIISKTLIPNNAEAILDYLTRRTDETVGKQIERVDAIVVGRVEKYESQSIPVRTEHVQQLKPWLSGDAGGLPAVFVQITTIKVETWLMGPVGRDQLDIITVYPVTAAPGSGKSVPVFHSDDRGLLYLQKVPPDAPYTPYVPDSSYQAAEWETGIRNFLVSDYDENGHPFTKNETVKIEEEISAIKWYIALKTEKPETLQEALLQSVANPNSRISRQAVRALAYRKEPGTAAIFKQRLTTMNQDMQVRLMLGLWILRERDTAVDLLHEFFQKGGQFAWLAGWDIQPTIVENGQVVETLYGPDPGEVKGD